MTTEAAMADSPVTHYASSTEGLVSDIQQRIVCSAPHWALVTEHVHQVTCPDCRKVIADAAALLLGDDDESEDADG